MTSSPDPAIAGHSVIMGTTIPLAILTVLAGIGGSFLGAALVNEQTGASIAECTNGGSHAIAKSTGSAHDKPGGGGTGENHAETAEAASSWQLKTLAPIVTNLGSPEKTWIRLQSAVVYDATALQHPDILFAEIMSDVIAFLRTQTLASIEGAEGLRHLQEDLNERVLIRSEGRARELIIETMVVQ